MYGILYNGTKALGASNNRYGNQTVKMDSRVCNYFYFFTLSLTVDVSYVDIRVL